MNKTVETSLREALTQDYNYARISFWLNGKAQSALVPPAMTTLQFLQQTQQLFGTKCSCNEGDCGACTVVVASAREGKIFYEAVTSCLYSAAKLHGQHLITIEGLGTPDQLHPIQKKMLEHHSTQCGYCTPGFVMSLFALLAMNANPSEEEILRALEGNLCRCTGYDSILVAARDLAQNQNGEPVVPQWCREVEAEIFGFQGEIEYVETRGGPLLHCRNYLLPKSLEELAGIAEQNQGFAFVSGGTDIMVQMNVQRKSFPLLVDLSAIAGLDLICFTRQGIRIGANVTYSMLLQSGIIKTDLPVLHELVKHIASTQIRNFATLAGNIANASPIGDSLPLLLALDASLELFSAEGERTLPLSEFYLDYRKTALQKGEMIKAVLIPVPRRDAFVKSIKAAKRKAVDISSVVTAVLIDTENGRIKTARLAAGGVAVVPKLSIQFLKAMQNMELRGLHAEEIAAYVAAEFVPITDVRGSREYRSKLVRNHVYAYLRELLDGRQG